MGAEPSDVELLHGTSPASFDAFYRRYVALVHGYVDRRTRRADQTFDLVAETFARALAARDRFDPSRGPAIAWLLGIARNQLIDAARRGKVADATRRRLGMERIVLPGDPDAADDAGLESPFDPATVAAALEALPPEQRDAIRSRIVDEEPYDAIAERVGCSEQVVRKRVSRGLAAARRAIEEQA